MKKLILLLLIPLSIVVNGQQKDRNALITQANAIKNATSPNSVTQVIVGNMFLDIIKNTQNIIEAVSTSGTNSYTASYSTAVTSYVLNSVYVVTFVNTNTAINPTLSINSLGALNIINEDGTQPGIAEIPANTTKILRFNGSALQIVGGSGSGGGGGSGITAIATTGPITGGPITTSGTIGIDQSTTSTDGYLSSTDWNLFKGKQDAISLTTAGTSGAATLIGTTLNIPQYAGATYTAGTGLTLTTGAFSVNTSQNISTLSNLTSNGLIKTSGGTGALSIATAGTDYQAVIPFGTGVLTALGINIGSAGSIVVNGGALGTPTSGVATNLTGTASGLTAGTVTTNANLVGDVISSGNTTTYSGTVPINKGGSGQTTANAALNAFLPSQSSANGKVLQSDGTNTSWFTTSSSPGASSAILLTDGSGIIGSTGTRITKGWFTDLTVTNAIAGSVTGNAATVTTNANLTGDVTSSGNATTLATVNSNVGSFGSTTSAPSFTVNGKGLITAAGSNTITPAIGSITGLGTGIATAAAINSGSSGSLVVNPTNSSGVLNNNGSGSLSWTPNSGNITVQTLTDGATITWNVTNGINATVTIGATGRTLSITNPVAGQVYLIVIVQDGTGSRTITTWPTGTKWVGATAPTLTTTAAAKDMVMLYYDGTNYFGTYSYNYN